MRVCEDSNGGLVVSATDGGTWKVEDIQPAKNVSFAALLNPEYGALVEAAVRGVPEGRDVVVETSENASLLRHVEETCSESNLDEPWHQDDISSSWTMHNPILRTGVPVDEPSEGGKLSLAILPDALAECTTEAACRNNDERFAQEKPTREQLFDVIKSLGGDEATKTIPTRIPSKPLEWRPVEMAMTALDVNSIRTGDAMATALAAPLRALCGYAALTRHGMLGDEYMPGIFTQALPLLVRPANRKRKKTPPGGVIQMQMASAPRWKADTRVVRDMGAKEARILVSELCTAGAAVKLV